MLIGLSGYARSGKDTLGQALVDHHGFQRIAFADKLRAVALDIDPYIGGMFNKRLSEVVDDFGWDRCKVEYPEVRRLLQSIGCAVRDHVASDAWLDAAFADFDRKSNYVITDMRFPNEYDAIKKRGGQTVRLTRPGVEAVNAHVSERALDDYPFDAIAENNGTIEDIRRFAAYLANSP